ncbi:MAG: adenylosuccinate lyase [Bacteroidales bacterium]|nr:adenylosuccinate lyase [Bacteroidales bacterium]
MVLSSLNAISPIDGRYRFQNESLSTYFSEMGLIRYRVQVEIEYFIALCEYPLPHLQSVSSDRFSDLRRIYTDFTESDAEKVKEIEKITNHDVKAVEYFIKDRFDLIGLSEYKEFIHFGLTSQDINNTATPLSLKEGFLNVLFPEIKLLVYDLKQRAKLWKKIPMLARTHGQPASPTRLGKEIYVFVERLENQLKMLDRIPFAAKFGGATGNFNAHVVAYPEIDWAGFGNDFVKNKLGLTRLQTTTQIEHYDYLASFFDNLKRINTILIDLNRDIWAYISMDYFKQTINKGEVGSSAMPHKINPIDFENSEGNLGLANALFEHLSAKLPISRLQRDLTDSTVTRNLGVPLGHSLLAYKSLRKGLSKLILNEAKIAEDLDNNWAVVAEAIQTILRRENYPNPYEALKALTRTNKKINQKILIEFVDNLDITESVKVELKAITPSNYVGVKGLN